MVTSPRGLARRRATSWPSWRRQVQDLPRRLVTDKLRRDAAAHRVLNLFRIGRHLLRAVHHRLMRSQAVGVWRDATCA